MIDHRAWLACQNVENRRCILLLHWLGVTLVLDRQADLPLGLPVNTYMSIITLPKLVQLK